MAKKARNKQKSFQIKNPVIDHGIFYLITDPLIKKVGFPKFY
jgi:hypothetical protein